MMAGERQQDLKIEKAKCLFEVCGKIKRSSNSDFEGPNREGLGEVRDILRSCPEAAKVKIGGKTALHVLVANPKAFDFAHKNPGQRGVTEEIIGLLLRAGLRLETKNDDGVSVRGLVVNIASNINNESDRVDKITGSQKSDVIIGIIEKAQERELAIGAMLFLHRSLGFLDLNGDGKDIRRFGVGYNVGFSAEWSYTDGSQMTEPREVGVYDTSVCDVNIHRNPSTGLVDVYSVNKGKMTYSLSVDGADEILGMR